MIVEHLSLVNWMCYRGSHSLDLPDGVIAVVGRHRRDARRSNWAGKTALLEAVRYGLYGEHRFARLDDAITHGEESFEVRLVLSGGWSVSRRKRRAEPSAQLLVVTPDGREISASKVAAAELQGAVGMSPADFAATCWIGQKQASAFVVAAPAERFAKLKGWVDLGLLQSAEELAADELKKAEQAVVRLRAQRDAIEVRDVSLLDGEAVRAEERAVRLKAERDQLAARMSRYGDLVSAWGAWKERVELEREFSELRARAMREGLMEPVGLEPLEAEWREAVASRSRVESEVVDLKRRAVSGFDGKCPVDPTYRCPAGDELDARVRGSTSLLGEKSSLLKRLVGVESAARDAVSCARERERERAVLLRRRDQIKDRLVALAGAVEPTEPVPDLEGEFRDLSRRVEEAAAEAARARAELDRELEVRWRLEEVSAKLAAEEARLERLREGREVLGRRGAQRRLAAAALDAIEQGANSLLRDAGIDLSVSLGWGDRQGKEDRLMLELSDRSGAAEDLAGVALQLSAAAYVRSERGVPWATAFIDEPFGALDEANRRAFSQHLVSMLSGRYGFRQAFVVAHSDDVLDAMPRRLVVTATGRGAELRVEGA